MNANSDKMFLFNDNNTKENHVCLFHLKQLSIVIANDSKRILPTNGMVTIHPSIFDMSCFRSIQAIKCLLENERVEWSERDKELK